MDPREALRLTALLLQQHNLSHITVTTMRSAARLAECRFKDAKPHTIALSAPVVRANDWEALAPVVLHEIAHAIAGFEAGHGPAFRTVAIALGGVPEPTHTMPNLAAGGWHATCELCGRKSRMARLSRRRYYCVCTREMFQRPHLLWVHADGRRGTCLDNVVHSVTVDA